jgi:hypothetical protein
MQRCCSGMILLPAVCLVLALTGCLGSSTPVPANGGVKSVSINPSGNISLEVGTSQVFTASALDANGRAIAGVNIQYVVSVPAGAAGTPPISITGSGNACAGTWNTAQALCSPGTPGIALVQAVANGFSSAQTTIYVHQHIDTLQIAPVQAIPPTYDCFSQGQTWLYQARAYYNGVDITNSVGPIAWASSNATVFTATSYVPPLNPNILNQVKITASVPGVTSLFATASGTTSSPMPLTTCLVRYVRLQVNGTTADSIAVNTGSSVAVQATAVDTLGNVLSKPPLTWSTSNPEVIEFSTASNTTGTNNASARNNSGGATLTASCTPPTCNIGVVPGIPVSSAMPVNVYASNGPVSPINQQQGYGAVSVTVIPPTTIPTYLGWAATTQCNDAPGCTSVMFQITPGLPNPVGTTIVLPRTPNSLMFNYQSSTVAYIGSDQGLMYYTLGGSAKTPTLVSSSSTPCNVALCGKVIAISNDGKIAVVSDDISPTPQVYIYNSGSTTTSGSGTTGATITDLVLSDVAKVAVFSPDQSKIFLVTNSGILYVYSTVAPLGIVPTTGSPAGTSFSADGSFAYVATEAPTTPPSNFQVNAYSMCAPTASEASLNIGTTTTSAYPIGLYPTPAIQASPNQLIQNVIALDPPYVQVLTAEYTQNPISTTLPLPSTSQFFCNVPTLNFTSTATYNLGQSSLTPVYSRLTGSNGTQLIIVARYIPAVLIFNVNDGTTTSIPLVKTVDPQSASASSDGSQIYVASCDQYPNNDTSQPCTTGTVHIVDTLTGRGDYQQVSYINNITNNMCNGQGGTAPVCWPNLVAIKPQ